MIQYTTSYLGREVLIRDLEERDVDRLAAYWHENSPALLQSLGVDLSKLKRPEDTRQRFLSSIHKTGAARERVCFVVESRNSLIAYTNLNIRSMEEAYGHFHVLQPSLWARAVSYVLFPTAVQIFFEVLPLRRVMFQTSPENRNINRMLRNFGLEPLRVHLDAPDGMARRGEFNVYTITREAGLNLSRVPMRRA
jgi:RimJ/RimL family protein N-acetyltransferase